MIDGASSSRCSAARRLHGRSLCARLPTMMFTCGSQGRGAVVRDRACIHTPIKNDAASNAPSLPSLAPCRKEA